MVYGFFYSRKISNGTYFQASSGNDFQASIGKIHTTHEYTHDLQGQRSRSPWQLMPELPTITKSG